MAPLPPELLQAVAQPQGGAISLMLGAGCSVEPPTNLPLGDAFSLNVHERLVADHVLGIGACGDPADLSAVADAVVAATQSQSALVSRLPLQQFKNAKPNEGYLIAAALIREGVITHIVSLNFDLAISHALSMVNASEVSILRGPQQHPQLGALNVMYLHGNVDSMPEEWVLGHAVHAQVAAWIQAIVARVFSGAITVLVGLGAPAGVFLDSARRTVDNVRRVPGARLYQVGPGGYGSSAFTGALGITPEEYVQMGWCDFMRALGERLTKEHLRQLSVAADDFARRNGLGLEDIREIVAGIGRLGILGFGFARGSWFLEIDSYVAWRNVLADWIADLILILGLIERNTQLRAIVREDGSVELRRANALVAVVGLAHGRSREGFFSMEQRLYESRSRSRRPDRFPRVVLISGSLGPAEHHPTPPLDIVHGDRRGEDIVGEGALLLLTVDEIRANPVQMLEMIFREAT